MTVTLWDRLLYLNAVSLSTTSVLLINMAESFKGLL